MTFRFGDPRLPRRFWDKVSVQGKFDCWLWTASQNGRGYGQYMIRPAKRASLAHRVAYEALVATIPGDMEIDHLCRTPACCNPAHLEAVTHRENILRGDAPPAHAARKTTCDAGHPLDGTRGVGSGRRIRYCTTCRGKQRAAWDQRYRDSKREKAK